MKRLRAVVFSALVVSGVLVALLVYGEGRERGRSANVVAIVDGTSITAEELEAYALTHQARAYRRLQQQTHQMNDRLLDAVIGDRLLNRVAKHGSLSVDEYLARRVFSSIPPVTDAEIADLYAKSPPKTAIPFDIAKPRIRGYLEAQKREAAKREHIGQLRSRAQNISVLLDAPRQIVQVTGDEPSKGAVESPVQLVVFSDFQCPFCKQLEPILVELLREFDKTLRVVWKDAPSPTHLFARGAAEAARCAKEVGAYWPFHETLFQKQDKLGRNDLREHADALGVDRSRFDECLNSGRHRGSLVASIETARKYGVNATPTLFINGRMIEGLLQPEEYRRIIRLELERLRSQQQSRNRTE